MIEPMCRPTPEPARLAGRAAHAAATCIRHRNMTRRCTGGEYLTVKEDFAWTDLTPPIRLAISPKCWSSSSSPASTYPPSWKRDARTWKHWFRRIRRLSRACSRSRRNRLTCCARRLGELQSLTGQLSAGGAAPSAKTAELIQQSLHKSLADMQQLAQAAYQTQAESYAVIAKRVEENVQELKSLLQQQKK